MLMGRGPERQTIDRLLSGARLGQSGALLITGEPGVGKTALLDEARERAAGLQVLRAVGTESERAVPFGGLYQLLRPALVHLDQIPGPQADALGVALALRSGPSGDRFAIGAATLSLVCRYAETAPVLVLVDDLHLLDRASAQAIAFAARRLVADPIGVLATARTGALAEIDVDLPTLELRGLDTTAGRELVTARAGGHPVTADLMDRLQRATAGNPLALVELADDLAELERAGPDTPLPVSSALAAGFAARARALSDPARDTLVVAAAVGGDLALVTRVCAELHLDPATLAEAESARLVRVGPDRVEFRHPLVRAAVYGDATPERRRSVHRAVAAALPADADARAWHLADSVIGPDPEVARLLATAGTRAEGRGAPGTAAAAFERAARLTPEPAARAARYVAAAELHWLAGAGNRANALLDVIDEPSVGPELRQRMLQLRAGLAARSGSLAEARDLLDRAAGEALSPADATLLLADAVYACFFLADAPSALGFARRLEHLVPQVPSAQTRAIGTTAAGVARVLANRDGADQIESAIQVLGSSAELRADERRATWLMVGPLFLREAGTGDELRRSVEDVRRRAAVGVLPSMLFHLGRDEATTDRWSRAEATYAEGMRLARETDQSTDLAMSLAGSAWLLARQGRTEECRRAIAEGMPLCVTRDIHLGRSWLMFADGDLALTTGDPASAAARYAELEVVLSDRGMDDPDLSPVPEHVEALVRLGRTDEARRLAVHHSAKAVRKGRPWACARAERALGLTVSDDEIDERFGAALELHARTLDGYEQARTALAYGERLRRARRRVEARPHLRSALAQFAELPAGPWAERAATELEATGEVVRRREQSAIEQLTPQERQITLLLVDGRTTREVAAAMFLSPKTVEYHLRKVYLKLGVRSRSELAALAT